MQQTFCEAVASEKNAKRPLSRVQLQLQFAEWEKWTEQGHGTRGTGLPTRQICELASMSMRMLANIEAAAEIEYGVKQAGRFEETTIRMLVGLYEVRGHPVDADAGRFQAPEFGIFRSQRVPSLQVTHGASSPTPSKSKGTQVTHRSAFAIVEQDIGYLADFRSIPGKDGTCRARTGTRRHDLSREGHRLRGRATGFAH
jgi:hypothetical protein